MTERATTSLRPRLLCLALCAALHSPASALDFGAGAAPIAYEPGDPFSIEDDAQLVIEGAYEGAAPTTVVLRIDDEWGPSDEQRFEKAFPAGPGAFKIIVPTSELVAADGEALRLDDLKRVVVFSYDEDTQITRLESGQPSEAEAAQAGRAARQFGTGQTPIAFEGGDPFSIQDDEHLVIEGAYEGATETTLVLRVEDEWAPTDEQRFQKAFAAGPGAFRIVVPTSELIGADAEALRLDDLKRIVLFSHDEGVSITRFYSGTAGDEASPVAAAAPKPKGADRADLEPIDFGKGPAPIEHSYYFSSLDLSGYDEILLEGVAETNGGLWLVLRIDDSVSSDYAQRFNLEIELTEGPFKIRAPLGGLRSPSGRIVNPADVTMMVAYPFGDDEADKVEITRFEARQTPRLPNGAIGYAFGDKDQGVPPGFERITPTDPRLTGDPHAVSRVAPDPLVANGIGGVSTVQLDAPAGEYRVTVWSEDPGQWEYLPHPLRRVIIANGVKLRDDTLARDQWMKDRYLSGLQQEHGPEDDAYSAYGAFRGEPRSADVTVGDDGLLLKLGGQGEGARHISAVLIEPIDGAGAAFDAVEEARAEWYRGYWRLDPKWREDASADAPTAARITFLPDGTQLTDAAGEPIAALKAVSAPGVGVRVTLAARGHQPLPAKARLIAPTLQDGAADAILSAELWHGQWRLERRRPEDTLLSLADNTLLPGGDAVVLADRERRYEMWFDAAEGATPGLYVGAIEIETEAGLSRTPIEIEILDVSLPKATEPAGFYMTEAPHMTWFGREPLDRQRQAACDARLMARFDLLGSAPAVRPPEVGGTLATTLDLRLPHDSGFTAPWLAYNPIRPLQFDLPPDVGAGLIAEIEAQLKAAGAPPPYWSVADELSNPGDTAVRDFWPWVKALRAAVPGVKLAGHLNNPDDRQYLDAFDAVLLNFGFGLDAGPIAELTSDGLEVWLYNTWRPRMTAGYWLWATDASRYVQWHSRLPTADPFDPIDGREGDVQTILPSVEICAAQPGLHRDFLRLAEGVVDQRWLLWLDSQASDDAKALRGALIAGTREGYEAYTAKGDAEAARVRAAIVDLARGASK